MNDEVQFLRGHDPSDSSTMVATTAAHPMGRVLRDVSATHHSVDEPASCVKPREVVFNDVDARRCLRESPIGL